MGATILEQIGGKDTLVPVVSKFYEKLLADPEVAKFFENVDMASQMQKQRAFLEAVFSNNAKAVEQYMARAHAKSVAAGLSDRHFDVVAGHLQGTLDDFNVPKDIADQIMVAVGGLRDAVLGRVRSVA